MFLFFLLFLINIIIIHNNPNFSPNLIQPPIYKLNKS